MAALHSGLFYNGRSGCGEDVYPVQQDKISLENVFSGHIFLHYLTSLCQLSKPYCFSSIKLCLFNTLCSLSTSKLYQPSKFCWLLYQLSKSCQSSLTKPCQLNTIHSFSSPPNSMQPSNSLFQCLLSYNCRYSKVSSYTLLYYWTKYCILMLHNTLNNSTHISLPQSPHFPHGCIIT